MGTRSTTTVLSNGQPLVNMYRQMDGYPSGHGTDLYDFLKDIKMVNGIGGDTENIANGAGCLAAQLVELFKRGPGGIYLVPLGQEEEYNYFIDVDFDTGAIKVTVTDGGEKPLFKGTRKSFGKFCAKEA